MLKEQKETRTTAHQVQTINKETGIIKRDQIEILELKSTITDMKSSLEGSTADLKGQKEEAANQR